jgi:hypothetical protein
VLISTARLRATDGTAPIASTSIPVSVLLRKNAFLNFAFNHSGRVQMISGLGYLPGWSATLNGEAPMVPIELDTQSGWIASSTGASVVSARFTPQVSYVFIVLIWLAGLLGAAMIAGFDPRARRVSVRPRYARPPNLRFIGGLLVVMFNFAIAGFPGAVISVIALEMVRRRKVAARSIGVLALIFMLLMLVAMVPPLGPELTPLGPGWVKSRGIAHLLAQFGAVFVVISIGSGSARLDESEDTPDELEMIELDAWINPEDSSNQQ